MGDVKPWTMGGRESMCHHPVLIFPSFLVLIQPPPFKALLLVGAVMARSGVWQDCQSLPTCTLHQWFESHDGKENDYAPHSTHSTMPFSPLSVYPHIGDGSLFIIMHKHLFCFDLMQPGGGSSLDVIHIPAEWYLACFPSEF